MKVIRKMRLVLCKLSETPRLMEFWIILDHMPTGEGKRLLPSLLSFW